MTSNMQEKEYQELPEEMYRMLFENACDAIFVADVEGNFIAVNQAACDHVGFAREALLRMRPEQINGHGSSEEVSERLARIRKDGECTYEAVHVHRDGKQIPVEMHFRLIEHGGQRIILNICRNIASRKQSEIEYRKIIQATGDGYWMVNAQDARGSSMSMTLSATWSVIPGRNSCSCAFPIWRQSNHRKKPPPISGR